MGNLFSDLLERFKTTRGPRIKKLFFWIIAVFVGMLLLMNITHRGTEKRGSNAKVSLGATGKTISKPELSYEFIKFDTMKIPNFALVEKPIIENSRKITPIQFAEHNNQPDREIKQTRKPARSAPTTGQLTVQPESYFSQPEALNKNPNMIVTNNLASTSVQAGTTAPFTGMQSALIKVVLPNRTPVANGSLVEARVLHDSRWENIVIPRRSKLIGVASLFNRRVNIEFREIYVNDVSRSCRGRAYDLKRLQGLAYSPVSSEARRILLEELRDAVAGVPVVGRIANRATYSSNYYDQDVSELDEGLEFYALIESIY